MPVVFVAGVHRMLWLFGTERVRLDPRPPRKNRRRAVAGPRAGDVHRHDAGHVGLDPRDVHFAVYPADESIQLLATGKIDAYLGFPPAPQELRGRTIGTVVVNSALDRPGRSISVTSPPPTRTLSAGTRWRLNARCGPS